MNEQRLTLDPSRDDAIARTLSALQNESGYVDFSDRHEVNYHLPMVDCSVEYVEID